MQRFFLGIDPGVTGALAFYDPKANELTTFAMPAFQIKKSNGKMKREVDIHSLNEILHKWKMQTIVGFVEAVHAMPKQGVTSSFSFGFAAGAAQMAVAANHIALQLVDPAVWKRFMKLKADKDSCRREASRLMPKHSAMWAKASQDGIAEAALIAYYASLKTHEALL